MLIGARAHLNGIAYYMKNNLSDAEYKEMSLSIASAMADTVELSARLHMLFPDILPKELTSDE